MSVKQPPLSYEEAAARNRARQAEESAKRKKRHPSPEKRMGFIDYSNDNRGSDPARLSARKP